MRAVWYETTGPAAEVLSFGEQAAPHAGTGEVRVRLHASGVNPADCNRRAGKNYQMEYPLVIPNSDGAGVIDEVGPGVDSGLLGQRVWLYNGQRGRAFGTAAEYIALDAALVSPLHVSVGFEAGACLGIPCMTAHRCVNMDGPVTDQTILVAGGAGAVGHYAIQLAKWAGARVITTVSSTAKATHAHRAKADLVLNYRADDVVSKVMQFTGGKGVDRVVEVDFGGNLDLDLQVLKANGTIATYASRGNPTPTLPVYALMRKNLTIRAVLLPAMPVEAQRFAQREINRWLQHGSPVHTTSATFPLERTADAHEAVEAGNKVGTVVVLCNVT